MTSTQMVGFLINVLQGTHVYSAYFKESYMIEERTFHILHCFAQQVVPNTMMSLFHLQLPDANLK